MRSCPFPPFQDGLQIRSREENLLIIKSDESAATLPPDHRWDRFTRRYFPYFCVLLFSPLWSLVRG